MHGLALTSHCGICGGVVLVDERCRALTLCDKSKPGGTDGSTLFPRTFERDATAVPICTNIFSFPDYGIPVMSGGLSVCRDPQYGRMDKPESVTMHCDCFSLLLRECKYKPLLHRLWVFAAWRIPWRRGPTHCIDDSFPTIPYTSAFPILKRLPPEIILLIRKYSSSSILWRLSLTLRVARQLSTPAPGDLVSMPLRDVLGWIRGGSIEYRTPSQPVPRCIFITIDAFGIQKLKASVPPPYTAQPLRGRIFLVADMEHTDNVTALFRFGALRLELPSEHPGFQTWDTRSLPPSSRTCLLKGAITHSTHFRTINFRGITGITFMFSLGELFRIHAHSAIAPYATPALQDLPIWKQELASWAYLPISPHDSIIAFGSLIDPHPDIYFSLVFLLRLAGYVFVGPLSGGGYNYALTAAPVAALVHDVRELRSVSVIGGVFENTNQVEYIFPLQPPIASPFDRACFSSAPLQDVIHIQVFNAKDGNCRGILLDYKNGARRALGQCRVGVDLAESFVAPVSVCFRNKSAWKYDAVFFNVIVNSNGPDVHHHKEEDWVCCGMDCNLVLWFNNQQAKMCIINEG